MKGTNMAKYRQIHVAIWENDDFLELSAHAQLQFLYLCTCPGRTESGLFKVSTKIMYQKTHTEIRDFDSLASAGFVDYDQSNKIVWIVSAMNPEYWNPSVTTWKSVFNDLRRYRKSVLTERLIERWKETWEPLAGGIDGASMGDIKSTSTSISTLFSGEEEEEKKQLRSAVNKLYRPFVSCEGYGGEYLEDDDVKTLEEMLRILFTSPSGKERADSVKLEILTKLRKFPLWQVLMSAKRFIQRDIVHTKTPPFENYFFGFCRNSKAEYEDFKQKLRHDENRKRKEGHDRTGQEEGTGEEGTSPDRRGDSGFQRPGGLLPDL